MAAGAVASQAEDRKKVKYSYLEGQPGICFTPIAYETSGVVGPLSLIFLGHRLSATTGKLQLPAPTSFSGCTKGQCSIIGTLFTPTRADF